MKVKRRFKWVIPFLHKPRLILRKPEFKIPSLSRNMMTILTLILVWFFFGGGLYAIVEKPAPIGFTAAGSPVFLYPQFDRQFLIEGFVAGILFILGGLGFILMYMSTKYAYDPKYASLLLYVGIALIIVSYLGVRFLLESKLDPFAFKSQGPTGQAPSP